MKIHILDSALRVMMRSAIETENEVIGMLYGTRDVEEFRITEVSPCTSAKSTPESTELDHDVFERMNEIQTSNGVVYLGDYHSHPYGDEVGARLEYRQLSKIDRESFIEGEGLVEVLLTTELTRRYEERTSIDRERVLKDVSTQPVIRDGEQLFRKCLVSGWYRRSLEHKRILKAAIEEYAQPQIAITQKKKRRKLA